MDESWRISRDKAIAQRDEARAERDRAVEELERIANDPARAFSLRERGFLAAVPVEEEK